jgi:hypothetical protein
MNVQHVTRVIIQGKAEEQILERLAGTEFQEFSREGRSRLRRSQTCFVAEVESEEAAGRKSCC